MKKNLFLLLGLAAVTTAANADLVIEQKVDNPAQKSVVTMKIKGDKLRTDVGEQMTTIMDTKTGDTVTLMHPNKMAMKVSGEQVKALQKQMAGPNGEGPKPVNTGKTEKVDGYDCTIWTLEMAGVKSTMWVAKDYPNYDAIKKEMDSLATAMGQNAAVTDMGGMVVKTVADAGGMITTATVTSVKADPIDDAIFVVPAGYNEMKTP